MVEEVYEFSHKPSRSLFLSQDGKERNRMRIKKTLLCFAWSVEVQRGKQRVGTHSHQSVRWESLLLGERESKKKGRKEEEK